MGFANLSREELITRVKELEAENKELKEIEQRMSIALDYSKLIIAKCDKNLRYEWIYNAHSDFSDEEKIGKRDDELNQGPGIEALMDLKRQVMGTGQKIHKEITFKLSTGEINYDVAAQPVMDSQGTVVGVITVSLDVTEFKKVYTKLFKESKKEVLTQLAIGISHQINNVLAVIMGDVEMVLFEDKANKIDLSTKARKMLVNIKQQCNKAKRLIFDLKSMSRNSSDNYEEFSIVELMEEVLTEQNHLLKLNKIKLEKEYNISSNIKGDQLRLKRAFSNLIINACQAIKSKDQGEITINITEEEGKSKVVVTDTGIGMSEKVQQKLFLPFFTTKGEWGTKQTNIKGVGLGLAITEKIIHEHQGQIKVDSEVGVGSTFTVMLPTA